MWTFQPGIFRIKTAEILFSEKVRRNMKCFHLSFLDGVFSCGHD